PSEAERLPSWRGHLQREELLRRTALSTDGTVAAIAAVLEVLPDDIEAVRQVVTSLESLLGRWRGERTWSLGLGGIPVVRAAMLHLILDDQVKLVPIAFVLMALLLLWLYRRVHGVVLPLIVAALPAALVMGIMGHLSEPIGVINQVYFTLLPVIAVSGGIHLMSRYYEELALLSPLAGPVSAAGRREAIVRAVRAVGAACLTSYATTMVGLLSLQVSSMPILRSFGLYSAAGVAFAWLTLVIVVPLVVTTTRGRPLPEAQLTTSGLERVLHGTTQVALRAPRRTLLATLVLLAVCAVGGWQVVIDNSLSGMLRDDHPVTRTGRLVDEALLGLASIEVELAGPPGTFDEPALLEELLRLEGTLRELPDVLLVHGPAGLVSRTQEALTGERGLPSTRELAAQLAFLQEGSGLYERFLTDTRDRARIVIRVTDIGGQRFRVLEQRVEAVLARFHEHHVVHSAQLRSEVTGTSALQYAGVNRLAEDLRLSLLTAWIIILAILLLLFRSPRIALVSVLPNALPLVAGYALLGYMGWPLEPGPAVIFTVALGIAVDDTLHILLRFEEQRHAGRGPTLAIEEALAHTGKPVVITSVILIVGFAVNMGSAFPNNARVGALGAFVIGVALLADLLLLPALLRLAFSEGSHERHGRGEWHPEHSAK
ncbi:MAG: efflux RND transporter permease subunit, partial [Myxococcota bacterium]